MSGRARVTAGEAILRAARLSGVDCVFGNPGTEFAPLIDALARDAGRGRLPRPVLVPHEFLGVAMAHGHYLGSGRAQMTAAHATVGAANALTALIGAARMNVPLLYLAGRTPVREKAAGGGRDKFIQWPQESFDAGAFAREWLKWDYEIRAPETAAAAVGRGLAIALSAPRGPVGLWVPREVLLARVSDEAAVMAPARPPAAAADDLDRAAEWLRGSRRGVIVANRVGEDPAAVDLLARLAERAGLAVAAPNAHHMNLPADHPCLIGPDAEGALAEADFVLVLDVDVPWCPLDAGPGKGAKVVQAGPDPLFSRIPMRGHHADLALTASARAVLEGLLARLGRAEAPAARRAWVAARRRAFERALAARRRAALASRSVTSDLVAVRLAERLKDVVVFNELNLNGELVAPTEPGSYFRSGSASGLGWGFGAALGHALARPDKTAVAVLGDGCYYLANPAAAHWAARAHELPVVVVVLNNEGMPSMRAPVERFFPGGAAERSGRYAFTDLRPAGDFAALAEAFGGRGLTVRRPAELGAALDAALDTARRERRHALVDVRLGP